jgi:UDP-N-acetylglucosamine:LPS N-acetylglucosamine transferase
MSKILLVSNSGDVVGGGEISLYFLIKYLDERRFQPVVLCPGRGRFFSKIEALGIQPKLLKMPSLKGKGLLSLPKTVQQLSRLVRREEIRLIHGNGSRCSIYAGLAARLTHVPLLWHVRIQDREPLTEWIRRCLALRSMGVKSGKN